MVSFLFYLQIMLLAPRTRRAAAPWMQPSTGGMSAPGRNCAPTLPRRRRGCCELANNDNKMLRQGDGQYPNGQCLPSLRRKLSSPNPCWRPLSGSDIGAGADGGALRRASARYHLVNSATHRLRFMGKSMGAIPGATPFVAREGRKPGVERSPGALVEPVPV